MRSIISMRLYDQSEQLNCVLDIITAV